MNGQERSAGPGVGVSALVKGGGSAGVPRPSRRLATRVLVPLGVLATGIGVLLYTGGEALRPAVAVRVVPVVLKGDGPTGGDDVGEERIAGHAGGGAVAAQAPGWIEPDPYAVNVSALANGVVREVLVLEGQRVEAGQVVARLIDDEARLVLVRAEAEVKARLAEMVSAEGELKHAKTVWDNPIEQTRAAAVAEAQLAEARAELARLPLEVAAQSSRLEELRDDLMRKEELLEKRAVSAGDVAQLRLRVSAQGAMLDSTRARQPVLEAKVRETEAMWVAARDDLRLRSHDTRDLTKAYAMMEVAKAALARAEAERDESRLRLERMEVKSPVGGVVLERLKAPGSKVMLEMDDMGSSWVVRVYDPAKLQVRVDVPLASAGGLGVGMRAEVTVEALPGKVFAGRVTRLVQEANIQKNTVQVKVALEAPAPEMKPEMLARVKLFALGDVAPAADPRAKGAKGGGGVAVLLAPAAALLAGADGVVAGATTRAWVVDQGAGAARLREVRLGSRIEKADGVEWVEVVEGLKPGDRLIAGDVSRLKDGARVRVVSEKEGGGHGVH
jgi:multidrug efflux pump subunit AcrA (membrane-fusion protein)